MMFLLPNMKALGHVDFLDWQVQLSGWCRGDAPDWGSKGPWFNSRFWQEFVLISKFEIDFLFCCCCVCTFLVKKPYLSWYFAFHIEMLIHFVYLTYFKHFERVCGYKDTDLASLKIYLWENNTQKTDIMLVLIDIFHILVLLVYCSKSWILNFISMIFLPLNTFEQAIIDFILTWGHCP